MLLCAVKPTGKLNISTVFEEFVQAYDVLPPSEKQGIDKFFSLTDLSKCETVDGCKVPPTQYMATKYSVRYWLFSTGHV
jgi:hypothetical protein